jgi:hypothetical protein
LHGARRQHEYAEAPGSRPWSAKALGIVSKLLLQVMFDPIP